MAQAGFVGIPILILVADQPQMEYLVRILLIFVVGLAILGFIFVPKLVYKPSPETLQRGSSILRPSSGQRRSSYKDDMESSQFSLQDPFSSPGLSRRQTRSSNENQESTGEPTTEPSFGGNDHDSELGTSVASLRAAAQKYQDEYDLEKSRKESTTSITERMSSAGPISEVEEKGNDSEEV
jgi:hypothetical protein